MNAHPPANWFEFWVRFVCGALLGGLLGLEVGGDGPASQVWLAVLGGSVVIGLVAGWFGDRFWYSLKPWF